MAANRMLRVAPALLLTAAVGNTSQAGEWRGEVQRVVERS